MSEKPDGGPAIPTCDWCGHQHPVTALCSQRPTWGRRGFLALVGAALVGAALPALPVVNEWESIAVSMDWRIASSILIGPSQVWLAT